MHFSESLCIIYKTVGIYRQSTFVRNNTPLHTTKLHSKIQYFLLFCRKIGVTVCVFFGVKFLAVNGVLVNYMRYALIYCRSFLLFCFSVETHQFLSAEYSNSEKYFAYIRFQREISNPSKSQKCCCCAASVQNPIFKQKNLI